MAMLCALPREEYGDFTLSLICQKDFTRGDVEAVFQVEQTKHDVHCGPLLSLSGDATLRTTAQPPHQNKSGIKCSFCTGEGHNEKNCYKKDHACKDAQKAVEECRANRDTAKPRRTNHAAAASSSLPAPVTRVACAGSGAAGNGVRTSADMINTTTHLERQATV
jgi:hypothetical protein